MAARDDLSLLMQPQPELKSKILRHVASGEGGQSRLLKLRSLSSSMKALVDMPLPNPQRSLFSNAVVSVGAFRRGNDTKNERSVIRDLRQLEAVPPPPSVSALNLRFIYPPPLPTQRDLDTFLNFGNVWREKVDWIRVKSIKLPLEDNESRLLSHPRLESLELVSLTMRHDREDVETPLEFPSFIQNLRSFSVRFCNLPPNENVRLLTALNGNGNLRSLRISAVTTEEANALGELIHSHRNDADFQLTAAVTLIPGNQNQSDGYTLARTILRSASQISLVEMFPETFNWMAQHLDGDERFRFVRKIESMRFWRRSRLIILEYFPNLRYLGGIKFLEEETREPLPQSLRVLRIEVWRRSRFLFLFFPYNLVQLNVEFGDPTLDLNYVVVAIDSLSVTCRVLTHLGLYFKSIEFGRRTVRRFPEPMTSLISVDFHSVPICPVLRMTCLLNLLRLHELPRLEKLTLSSFKPDEILYPEAVQIERRTMRFIQTGACAEVIRFFKIRNLFVTPEDRVVCDPVYAPLLGLAEDNRRRFQNDNTDANIKIRHHHFAGYCDKYEHPPQPPLPYRV